MIYEKALAELQAIVRELQEDAVGIDQLAEKVRRAAELIQFCREKLRQTDQEIGELFQEKE